MRELRIGICEDNEADAKALLFQLQQAAKSLGCGMICQSYSTGREFLEHYTPGYDLVFLDVELPDGRGDRIAARIREWDACMSIVFISRYTEYVRIGYQYAAVNYLLKPLEYAEVLGLLERFLAAGACRNDGYIWLHRKDACTKLYCSRLRYAETCERQILYHYQEQQFLASGSLSELILLLPRDEFFRTHNSYIVNLQYIDRIFPDGARYTITLVTGENLPLSRHLKKDLMLRLLRKGEPL